MSVKLTNFVKININHKTRIANSGTRDTAVVFHYNDQGSVTIERILLTTMPDVTASGYTYLAGIADYLESFFNNGGKKLYVISVNALSSTSFNNELEALPMEYIMVGLANDSNSNEAYAEADFRVLASAWNTSKNNEKIFQKIFVAEIPYSSGITDITTSYEADYEKVVSIENYVLKYGKLGVGASVLAYYTTLDAFTTDATQDYAFTTEVFSDTVTGYVFTDNDIVKKVMDLDLNCDAKLSGQIKNIGGNDTAGYDLTNQYMLLLVHQTLTTAVVQTLASKIKYNDRGIGQVLNAIVRELNQFVSNGYLSTNKVWTDPDLYYEGYKIIDTNTVLNTGYKVVILPFTKLSNTEIADHQLPKIYILLADSYSIRKVVIDGEVF